MCMSHNHFCSIFVRIDLPCRLIRQLGTYPSQGVRGGAIHGGTISCIGMLFCGFCDAAGDGGSGVPRSDNQRSATTRLPV
jgi:hypothetical protein